MDSKLMHFLLTRPRRSQFDKNRPRALAAGKNSNLDEIPRVIFISARDHAAPGANPIYERAPDFCNSSIHTEHKNAIEKRLFGLEKRSRRTDCRGGGVLLLNNGTQQIRARRRIKNTFALTRGAFIIRSIFISRGVAPALFRGGEDYESGELAILKPNGGRIPNAF